MPADLCACAPGGARGPVRMRPGGGAPARRDTSALRLNPLRSGSAWAGERPLVAGFVCSLNLCSLLN